MLAILVHVGYSLMLAGFLARDILVLRGLLVAAQVIVTGYAFSIGAAAIASWNALFAVINSVWVVLILRERWRIQIPPDLQPIHRTHFAAMTAGEFLRWWRLGRTESLSGAAMTRDGERPEALFFILDGIARVRRHGVTLTELEAGFFIGEMSVITGRPANADVDAMGDIRVQRWARAAVDDLRTRDLGMWAKVQSAIGTDLVAKIQRGELAAAADR